MIKKIDHIGIVVKDLNQSMRYYSEVLKLPFIKKDQSPEFNVNIAFFKCSDVLIELLCPYGPGINQDFLNATGGGIHHIAYEVDDLDSAYKEVSGTLGHKGDIALGANNSKIFFIDSKNLDNVETEFVEFP